MLVGWVVVAGLAWSGAAWAQDAQPAAKAAPVNDAQIAAIVVAANAVDAELGELAVEKASKAEVRQFGQAMATGHRALIESAGQLVTRLKVTPQENAVSKQLQADGAAVKAELQKKSGADFDRAYIAHEVAYHKAVLEAVDNVLIPNASNAELKQTLIDVRPAFVGHLKQAEQLLAGLK
jgi:putative membrane protein